jgi:lipopolysaccharide export system protein LptA
VIFNQKAGLSNKLPKTAIFCWLFAIAAVCSGMQPPQSPVPARSKTKIIIEYADSTVMDDLNPNIHVMRGEVRFRHDGTLLFCDSAYFYNEDNSLEAFSNVRIEQGDSVFIYGDFLTYFGNVGLAQMRNNVRMENGEMTLFTDHLDFDRVTNLGYFFDGGMMVDSVNELTSVYGQYSPNTKMAIFQNKVVLTNPQFVMKSDTLEYNTIDHVATIIGPSTIESDSGFVYSSRGNFNTVTNQATLYDRSEVITKDGTKTLTADTLFYNRETGFGEAFSNMVLNDTVKKMILTGNYGYYDDIKDFAFATDSAQFIDCSQADSLFLHGDTLSMQTVDSTQREIRAYYGVRVFRSNLQAVCDSLQFNTVDSTLYMTKNPILWNENYQITGDTIRVLFNDSTIERVNVIDRAFAMEEKDTTYFNQMKGRLLTAFFTEGELTQIDLEGNTEAIYYPIDEKDGSFIGLTNTESPLMTIYIENREPVRIWWRAESKFQTLPLPDLKPEEKFLKDFVNYNYLRPKDKADIFTPTVIKAEDIPAPRRHRTRQL